MAMRLESENVRYLEEQLLNECDFWAHEGKDAEKLLAYIDGVREMAAAVIKQIKELGGR